MTALKIISLTNGKESNSFKNEKSAGSSIINRFKTLSNDNWWLSFILLTTCAFITRLSYLGHLNITTWDEVHFGGFAGQYINRTFYHDVHPPLGKIFVAAVSYITGYQGNFNFSAGNQYDDSIRYQLIRSEMAILGALLVPIAFLTVYELTKSVGASTLGALGVLCDTFLHKINALILLDPPLILAITFCVLATLKVDGHREREWSVKWWSWLTLTGIGLGVVISIKYVGVFTVLFVGLHTAYQLFSLACDPKKPVWELIPHFCARVLCLILLPIAVYLSTFVLHFAILSETKPDHGGWLHSRFYASLNNTEYDNKIFPKYVNYGANVTIMSSTPPAGYLDSWYDLYPSDLTAPCQVVSTMPVRDPDGTIWRIRRVNLDKANVDEGLSPIEPPILVRNGDFVMLTHIGSERSLRSHGYRAPFTRRLYQICGYGDNGTGGPYETWKIVIPNVPEGEPLKVFEHDFMLLNYKMQCYMKSSDVKLPKDWANDGAKELGCTRNAKHSNLHWHINWINTTKVVGEVTAKQVQFGLWEKIKSLHEIMFIFNSGLKDDSVTVQDNGFSTSTPWMWPIAYRMQLLGGIDGSALNQSSQFAIAGFNPMGAYINLVSIFLQVALGFLHLYKILRIPDELPHVIDRRKNALWNCMWLSLCWGMHYLPFFFMGRTLYVHHYCPAYVYSCLITGVILNYVAETLSETVRNRWKTVKLKASHLLLIPASALIVSYVWLYPMATYVEGEIFKPVPRVHSLLSSLNFGQPWIEFGMQSELFMAQTLYTKMIPLAEDNFQNPHLNATLYYFTELNGTKSFGEVVLSPMPVVAKDSPMEAGNVTKEGNGVVTEGGGVTKESNGDVTEGGGVTTEDEKSKDDERTPVKEETPKRNE